MKALPKQFAPIWQKADCDPDGVIEFMIEPMTHRVMIEVQAINIKLKDNAPEPKAGDAPEQFMYVDPVGAALTQVKFQLKGLRGLKVNDSDEEFVLQFNDIPIAGKIYKVVTDACFEEIPYTLISEIMYYAKNSAEIPREVIDNVNFTSDSSPETCQPAEVAETAEKK